MAAALALTAGASAAQTFNIAGDMTSVRVTSMRDMPYRTVVRQQYDFSCGSAALATMLRHHYGRPVGEAAIFQAMYAVGDQAKIRKVGFSLLDMKNHLAANGLKADGYRRTLPELAALKTPAIALINVANYRHFVVIKGVRDGRVLVGDPAQGLKTYSLADFGKAWNGVIFAIDPASGPKTAYDQDAEWAQLGHGPFNPLEDTGLASFTRDLPPINQIMASRGGGGSVR